jgi:hypothetical protein
VGNFRNEPYGIGSGKRNVFTWEREPDPLWQKDLERIAPRHEKVSWLRIHWFAGLPYEPIQRWAIWEMMPQLHYVDEDILEDLRGPSPRENGYWQVDREIPPELAWKKAPNGDPLRWFSHSMVSLDQWTLFQQTNCLPVLCWIVQGSNGGHLYRLGQAEIGVLTEYGLEGADTPLPGDLPYADYDDRVSAKLAERDKLRQWGQQGVQFDERGRTKTEAGLWVRRERIAQEQSYNKLMMKHLEDQIETAFSDLSRVNLNKIEKTVEEPIRVDEDAIDEEFVTDTATTLEV